MTAPTTDSFITRWKGSGGGELANSQSFLGELCDLLGVPHPDPSTDDPTKNAYVFERRVDFANPDGTTSHGRIDLYKRGCFVLESKQGTERREEESALSETMKARLKKRKKGTAVRGTAAWGDAMLRAKGQADQYIRALPAEDGRPPFLIVVDVGYCIELYSEFTCTGGTYVPFPDPRSHRITLDDLSKPEVIDRLRAVWTDPHSLDPSRRSARVTREIADKLARLAKSLEAEYDAETVATFLMRCIFTMFAEDTRMLPKGSFTEMLQSLVDNPADFAPMVEDLWEKMKTGGYSAVLRQKVLHFNGYLFEKAKALPLTEDQIRLLIESGQHDWTDVEPAIFGTLLERALDPRERHKLGAHYTPRAYVERLVMPTIVEPLRNEWNAVQAAAVQLEREEQTKEAIAEVEAFRKRLCEVRVLDPACGSGNFLYVTMEHLKRIEGEVINTLTQLRGQGTVALEGEGYAVDPHQFLGLEVNPRAAAIAELVLWIGYLQWHYRTRGDVTPSEPVIRNFHNIECRDAVLEWDSVEEVTDEDGNPVTRWDGHTMKKHPVTGEDVPDETAQVPVLKYINPRKAEWPEADYIVGNPPFLGARRIRQALGDGYLSALRSVYDQVPEHCDYVMYWWHKSAQLCTSSVIRRFGLITTNSISQAFSRKLLQLHMDSAPYLSIVYATPDHPWVDSADGADVRVAMTVGEAGQAIGKLSLISNCDYKESNKTSFSFTTRNGTILPNLTIGADIISAVQLQANTSLSCVGYQLSGKGFSLSHEEAKSLGYSKTLDKVPIIKPLYSARDMAQQSRERYAIDLFGLSDSNLKATYPMLFQWLLDRVKPERDQNASKLLRKNWWLFARNRPEFRQAIQSLESMIATPLTAKHRYFITFPSDTILDSTCVLFALEDPVFLGILSSRIHIVWANHAGGHLGVGNDPRYLKADCFDPFPFPDATEEQKTRICELGEALDAHRKARQAEHPKLTLTNMYNVLEKLKSGEKLTAKEKTVHEQGLVSVLKQIHDDLDAAVADAYGWPTDLSDEEILSHLVDLNKERAAEEAGGHVRWLRPEYQCPEEAAKDKQATLVQAEPKAGTPAATAIAKTVDKTDWPESLPAQVQAVRTALATLGVPANVDAVAECFKRMTKKRKAHLAELLDTLASLGQARQTDDDRYLAA